MVSAFQPLGEGPRSCLLFMFLVFVSSADTGTRSVNYSLPCDIACGASVDNG